MKKRIEKFYKLTHQKLCVTSLNFARQTLIGTTILHLRVDTANVTSSALRVIKLNAKQLRILKLTVDDVIADFQYRDPSLDLMQRSPQSRDLQSLNSRHLAAIEDVDADLGRGEVTIEVPADVIQSMTSSEYKNELKIAIQFAVEKPQGGIHFVVNGNSDFDDANHVFTSLRHNQARLWFPCIDTYTEPCTWLLELTCDVTMTAVASGVLVETLLSNDRSRKTFRYQVATPTSAPNIGIAIGHFEILMDPKMHEITHFCLPRLKPLLRHTTSSLHVIIGFYEELLGFRFPFASYKQVFVDESDDVTSAFSALAIFDTKLLHSEVILDQNPETRKYMSDVITTQLFGCFMSRASWNDAWVTYGVARYLYGLWLKHTFGSNEYRAWIRDQMNDLCSYELDTGPLLLRYQSNSVTSSTKRCFAHQNPLTIADEHLDMVITKSHLFIRRIENRIGRHLLLQAINKLLSLATAVVNQKMTKAVTSSMLLTTAGFIKSIFTVSGKDLTPVIDDWLESGGVVCFESSFIFNRKRNAVELSLTQPLVRDGVVRYVGPLTVRLQELDGTFNHVIQIEHDNRKHDIPCHSKSRRNKKKKIPLLNGDEADIDLSAMDQDSPVMWLRIDPDLNIIRRVRHQQPDFMWQYQAKYERDVIGQLEAIDALRQYTAQSTSVALIDVIENEKFYYKVRTSACDCLRHVFSDVISNWTGARKMIDIFTHFFCCATKRPIITLNNFSNFRHYFLQRALLTSMSLLRDSQGTPPPDIVRFILDVIKLNDNSRNRYADNYYRATLVTCLTNMITPAVTLTTDRPFTADELSRDVRAIVDEVTRFLNIEKHLPSYRCTVTVTSLHAIRKLQRCGHLPPDAEIFKSYARPGFIDDVRIAALQCLVDLLKTTCDVTLLTWLLAHVTDDVMPTVRVGVLRALIDNPPFVYRNDDVIKSKLNTPSLVDELWRLINTATCHDVKARCEAIRLYHKLFGKSRPLCLPNAHMTSSSYVVNLKKNGKNDVISPMMTSPPHQRKRHRSPTSPIEASDVINTNNGIRMKIKLPASSMTSSTSSAKTINTDDVIAAESLLSLAKNTDVMTSSRPATPGRNFTPETEQMMMTSSTSLYKEKKKKRKHHKHLRHHHRHHHSKHHKSMMTSSSKHHRFTDDDIVTSSPATPSTDSPNFAPSP